MAPRTDGSGRSRPLALMLGVFGCEVAAALLVVASRPRLGILCMALGIAVAFGSLRRFRRAVRDGAQQQLASAWTGAARAAAEGCTGMAIAILESMRARTSLDRPAARLLIELHASTDDVGRAVEVALEHIELLGPDDVQNMITSLESWGERRYAAVLMAAVSFQRIATMKTRGNGNRRLPSIRTG